MGSVIVIRQGRFWDEENVLFRQEFDLIFSTTYAAGGDTIADADLIALYQGPQGPLPSPAQFVDFEHQVVKQAAAQTLTLAAQPANGDTVTIGTRVWTFKTALATFGDVLIGAANTNTLDNFVSAINRTAGYASTYYSLRDLEKDAVRANARSANTVQVQALVPGAGGVNNGTNYGNSIVTTKTGVNPSWGAGTLTGGAVKGWAVDFDVVTKKFSLWNGTTENATADVHLLMCRCAFVFPFYPSTTIGWF